MKLNGAQIVAHTLKNLGTEYVFGYPGFCVLPVYDCLADCGLKHVLTADERGACFAASGFARASRTASVVLATSGPGATNLVTGLADAFLDSVPLVAITGNVDQADLGHDVFQEVDTFGITVPVVKYNYLVSRVENLESTLRDAFAVANSGRKGPVLVDVPHNLFLEEAEFPSAVSAPLRTESETYTTQDIDRAAALVNGASKPAIYSGGGVRWAKAEELVTSLAEKLHAPVAVSFTSLSSVSTDNPFYVGALTKSNAVARRALAECDLLVCLGTRFNNKFSWSNFPKRMPTILHVDVDNAEFSKNLPSAFCVKGDIARVLKAVSEKAVPRTDNWFDGHAKLPSVNNRATEILGALSELLPTSQTVVTDVGLHQLWTASSYPFRAPNTFFTSGGLGAMGFGTGAAIGVALATGTRPLLVTGDGSFCMNFQEIATAVKYKLPLLVLVMNNNSLGLVRAQQDAFFGGRHEESTLNTKIDYARLAVALGAKGMTLGSGLHEEELSTFLQKAVDGSGVTVVDCRIAVNDTKY